MKVLIVGAGPTGLTMANELARRGIEFRIIDSAPGPCEQSRALGIHARTLEHLDMLGIIDRFLAEGNECHSVMMFDNGKKLVSLSLSELQSPYPFALILPQSRTESLLQDNLERLGGTVERKTKLVKLEQNADYAIATTRHNDESESSEQYQWVAGCDGSHSAVRHAVKATFQGSAYSEEFLLADVSITGGDYDRRAISLYTVNEGILAVFPFAADRARVIADVEATELASPSETDGHVPMATPTLEQMQEIVTRRGPAGMTIADAQWLAGFRIHRRQVDSYRFGRIFLCGDAAHVHSPAGGQGMNTGIQDAINLAWKLAFVVQGAASERLLDSYHDERHKVGEAVLRFTDFLTKMNMTRSPIARVVKNKLAPFMVAQEIIQQHVRDEVSEIAVKYRGSPIVSERKVSMVHAKAIGHSTGDQPELGEWFEFDKGPHPGDRAPDGTLLHAKSSIKTRIFELLRTPEHHLFLFTGIRATLSGNNCLGEIARFVVDKYSRYIKVHIVGQSSQSIKDSTISGSYLVDPEFAMHHEYGAGCECLYLIRPDGYIGFRSLPADKLSLDEYLCTIFA